MGGATVFPYANLTVYPKKGSALFWYNSDRWGNLIKGTKHCCCPVILGSKWSEYRDTFSSIIGEFHGLFFSVSVNVYFVNQTGQELIRPCGLKVEK